jgi:hypothetical protein
VGICRADANGATIRGEADVAYNNVLVSSRDVEAGQGSDGDVAYAGGVTGKCTFTAGRATEAGGVVGQRKSADGRVAIAFPIENQRLRAESSVEARGVVAERDLVISRVVGTGYGWHREPGIHRPCYFGRLCC